MAKHTTITITDDLDGSANADSVGFAYQGREYEIDLSPKNQRAFEKILKPYIDSARQIKGSRSRSARTNGPKPKAKVDLATIRAWAQDHGYEVSDRGRVPQAVVEAFEAANK